MVHTQNPPSSSSVAHTWKAWSSLSQALPRLDSGKDANPAGTAGGRIAAFGSVLAISFFLTVELE